MGKLFYDNKLRDTYEKMYLKPSVRPPDVFASFRRFNVASVRQ
jgi:hypothetical protein